MRSNCWIFSAMVEMIHDDNCENDNELDKDFKCDVNCGNIFFSKISSSLPFAVLKNRLALTWSPLRFLEPLKKNLWQLWKKHYLKARLRSQIQRSQFQTPKWILPWPLPLKPQSPLDLKEPPLDCPEWGTKLVTLLAWSRMKSIRENSSDPWRSRMWKKLSGEQSSAHQPMEPKLNRKSISTKCWIW